MTLQSFAPHLVAAPIAPPLPAATDVPATATPSRGADDAAPPIAPAPPVETPAGDQRLSLEPAAGIVEPTTPPTPPEDVPEIVVTAAALEEFLRTEGPEPPVEPAYERTALSALGPPLPSVRPAASRR